MAHMAEMQEDAEQNPTGEASRGRAVNDWSTPSRSAGQNGSPEVPLETPLQETPATDRETPYAEMGSMPGMPARGAVGNQTGVTVTTSASSLRHDSQDEGVAPSYPSVSPESRRIGGRVRVQGNDGTPASAEERMGRGARVNGAPSFNTPPTQPNEVEEPQSHRRLHGQAGARGPGAGQSAGHMHRQRPLAGGDGPQQGAGPTTGPTGTMAWMGTGPMFMQHPYPVMGWGAELPTHGRLLWTGTVLHGGRLRRLPAATHDAHAWTAPSSNDQRRSWLASRGRLSQSEGTDRRGR